jgi:hypothetical protein
MDLQSMFGVQPVPSVAKTVMPRRKLPVRPLPGLNNVKANWMKLHAYNKFGLQEYDDCWTGEMWRRPIPFVSTDTKPRIAEALLRKHLPTLMKVLVSQMEPVIQAINKQSSLGYPVNMNPGTGVDRKTGEKRFLSKFEVYLLFAAEIARGDLSRLEGMYNTIGPRLQNEPLSKERLYQFINSSGEVYEAIIKSGDREISVPSLGVMTGSRTRTIVRPPVLNLYTQAWDTYVHHAIMKHPLCDANMYTTQSWPSDSEFTSFDCKHYERYLGPAAIAYAEFVGGKYAEYMLSMIYAPYVVPSDDWSKVFSVKPQYTQTVSPQLGSGLSLVAPIGKLTNICAQMEYFGVSMRLGPDDAVRVTLRGESPGLRRWMYGDDNRTLGERSKREAFIKFMGEVFDIEIDDTPTYLGMIYRSDIRRFVLPMSTYQLKLYQPERDYSFKKYPNLGLVERRKVFKEFGEPEIASAAIPYEDTLWTAAGRPFPEVELDAVAERRKATESSDITDPRVLSDKAYLLTDAEQVKLGLAWHLPAPVTCTMVNDLAGPELKALLPFRNAPHVPIPQVDTSHAIIVADVAATDDEVFDEN